MVTTTDLRAHVLFGVLVASVSCRPEVEGRPSLIEGPRVLALRSIPAEASPGESVSYEALYVGPSNDALEPGVLNWQACSLRKPLSASGAVNPACLVDEGEGVVALGTGTSADATIHEEACRLFGPTSPDPVAGETALRAADPDTTGGYYQPVLVRFSEDTVEQYVIGVTRLTCGIGAAAQEQVIEYNQRYRRNANPAVAGITLASGDGQQIAYPRDATADPVQVSAKAIVRVEANWASCPKHDSCGDGVCGVDESLDECAADCTLLQGCSGAETYLRFDQAKRELSRQREQLRVSWYATAGRFEHDRTSDNVLGNDQVSRNEWQAPNVEGKVSFWVVLRDERRGVGWQRFDVNVTK